MLVVCRMVFCIFRFLFAKEVLGFGLVQNWKIVYLQVLLKEYWFFHMVYEQLGLIVFNNVACCLAEILRCLKHLHSIRAGLELKSSYNKF